MPDVDEAKNKAVEAEQQAQDQGEQKSKSMQDQASEMADKAKKKYDTNADGKVDADEMKQAGQDAVNKVKGLFKKS